MISDRVVTLGLRTLSHLTAEGRLLSHSSLKISGRAFGKSSGRGEYEQEVFFFFWLEGLVVGEHGGGKDG